MRSTAGRLPDWLGSIRFRLALLYSMLVFGLAVLVVGVTYGAASRSLASTPVTGTMERVYVDDLECYVRETSQFCIYEALHTESVEVVAPLLKLEREINQNALDKFRYYALLSLGGLFLVSIVVGWLVADRALRPIGRITSVARRIQATDLSRRIEMKGPHDELRELADTFDGMLGRLDDAFEGQRRFIHEASHELRNPIAVIRTNVDVALADPDANRDELRESLDVVGRSSERMSVLVDDLLTYARREAPAMREADVDLGEVVREVAEEFSASAEARGLQVDPAFEPGLTVLGDRVALKQALANLLANAVRLAPPGTTIRVGCGADGDRAWMAVEDEGPGIEPADQAKVFDRFFRGDPQRSRAEGRSGLGLTIVRQIAEGHGGAVGLSSAPGVGSTFSVWLPKA